MATLWRTLVSTFRRVSATQQPPEEDSLLTDFGSVRPVERVREISRVHSVAGASVTYQNQNLDFPRPWIRPQPVIPLS